MRRRLVFEQRGAHGRLRMYYLPSGLCLLDGLDGTYAVRSGHVHCHDGSGNVHRLLSWQVSGERWPDRVRGLYGWLLLRVCERGTAVRKQRLKRCRTWSRSMDLADVRFG